MASPPSSPIAFDASPPSSPIPERTPKKRRTWQVYDAGTSDGHQPSKSTSWRWKTTGFLASLGDEPETARPLNLAQCQVQDSGDEELHNCEGEPVVAASLCDVGSSSTCSSNHDSNRSSESEASAHSSLSLSEGEENLIDAGEEQRRQISDSDDSSVSSVSSDVESNEFSEDEEEDVSVPLFRGSNFSVDEAVLDVLTDYITNHETKKSLKDHLRTFLKYIPKPDCMPKNVDQLLKYVESLVPNYSAKSYSYCAKCLYFLIDENPCRSCNGGERHEFYLCSIEEQIKIFFEKYNLAEVLDKYGQRQSHDGKIRDVTDGSEFIRVKVNEKYSLTLMMNTDGVSVAGSSNAKMWPVMFVICELPPHLRQKYLIVHGIWCDEEDPPMNTYFKPIVEGLEHIHRQAGIEWTHPETQENHRSIVSVPVICADAPARAKLQNILSHTGKQGCNTCEQSTSQLEFTAEELLARAQGQKVKRKRAYLFSEEPARLRTSKRMKEQGETAPTSAEKNVAGVKGPTVLASIPGINMARSVFAEYMHSVCLGVVKRFLTLWLTVRGPWNISDKKLDIDNFMKSISPSSDIGRLPRGVSDLSFWKASELRSWLLFYSLVCLEDKLPHGYFQHWILLVHSIYLLLQEEISEADLNTAENLLKRFVRDVSVLYRDRDNVYNVHMLLHLVQYVRWHGPLSCNSAFSFENYNGNLANLIHGTKNRGKELMKNVRIAHAVEILRAKVISAGMNNSSQVLQKTSPLNSCTEQCLSEVDRALLVAHGIDSSSAKLFSRIRLGREIYTSQQYSREKKRNNFTIMFKHDSIVAYGSIYVFVVRGDDIFAVVKKFTIDHTKAFCYERTGHRVSHILHVCDTDHSVLVHIKNVMSKVIRVGGTVSKIPNRFEKNL